MSALNTKAQAAYAGTRYPRPAWRRWEVLAICALAALALWVFVRPFIERIASLIG